MIFYEEVGFWILFLDCCFGAFMVGYALADSKVLHRIPPKNPFRKPGKVWFRLPKIHVRFESGRKSEVILSDKCLPPLVPPKPPVGLGKNVILSADYETGTLRHGELPGFDEEPVRKKPLKINFEME